MKAMSSDSFPQPPPFTVQEKRFLLSETIKLSSIPIEKLLKIFDDESIQPTWPRVLLPYGRSLQSCIVVFDGLVADHSKGFGKATSLKTSAVKSINPPFTHQEQLFVLSEVVKTTSVPLEVLLTILREEKIKPSWTQMLVPSGRNLQSCIDTLEAISGIPLGPLDLRRDDVPQERSLQSRENDLSAQTEVMTPGDEDFVYISTDKGNKTISWKAESPGKTSKVGRTFDSDLESNTSGDAMSVFSSLDSTSSRSSIEDPLGATEEFVSFLIGDEKLKDMLRDLCSRQDVVSFRKDLSPLLKSFSRGLLKEAITRVEKACAVFIRRSRRRICFLIGQRLYEFDQGPKVSTALQLGHEQNKTERIEEYLRRLGEDVYGDPQFKFQLDEESSDDDSDHGNLDNLQQVKSFISRSQSLVVFKEALARILATSPLELGPNHEKRTLQLSSAPALFKRLSRAFRRLFRPRIQAGFQRLEWQCECGTWMYADLDDQDEMQLDHLIIDLSSVPYLTEIPLQGVTTGSESAHLTALGAGHEVGSTEATLHRKHAAPSMILESPTTEFKNSKSSTLPHGDQFAGPIKKYFGICVNVGEHIVSLGEVNVSTVTTDSEFFRKVWEKYEALRGFRARGLRRFLIKPTGVEFVHFTLEDHHRVDLTFEPPRIPPESEVRSGNYEYIPCPLPPTIKQPIPSHTFLHYCKHHEKTRSSVWLKRLPKKLHRTLLEIRMASPSIEYVEGWGVYIIEGPNWTGISWLGAVVMTCSVVVAVIYSCVTGDASSGFTIGAFIMSLWVSWLTAFYYRCKEL